MICACTWVQMSIMHCSLKFSIRYRSIAKSVDPPQPTNRDAGGRTDARTDRLTAQGRDEKASGRKR